MIREQLIDSRMNAIAPDERKTSLFFALFASQIHLLLNFCYKMDVCLINKSRNVIAAIASTTGTALGTMHGS